jgi:Tol biopolymer transport system component
MQAVLEAAGLEAAAAATVAETLIDTSLRGVDSHGVARVPVYSERLRSGALNMRPRPSVARREGAIAVAALALVAGVTAAIVALVVRTASKKRADAAPVLVPSSDATLGRVSTRGGRPQPIGAAGRFFFVSRPRPSPDGRRIVFGGQRCARCKPMLDVVPLSGGRVRAVYRSATEPDWAHDGRRIAFVYTTPNGAARGLLIYLIGSDGRNASEVELDEEAGEEHERAPVFHNPTFAPDGKLLAYDTETEPREVEQIFVLDRRTRDSREVTHGTTSSSQPAFSPDGREIVYACEQRGGSYDICLVGIDGGPARRLVATPGDDRDPVFSPDGKTVVFDSTVADRAHAFRSLYSVGRDGRRLQRLTSGFDASQPAFTPDGAQIVFVRRAIVRAATTAPPPGA